MKLSHKNYREAVELGFQTNCHNPTLFWNPATGFYVCSGLVENDDLDLGQCHYILPSGRSHSGTRREYAPIARGIRQATSEGRGRGRPLAEAVAEAVAEADYAEEYNN